MIDRSISIDGSAAVVGFDELHAVSVIPPGPFPMLFIQEASVRLKFVRSTGPDVVQTPASALLGFAAHTSYVWFPTTRGTKSAQTDCRTSKKKIGFEFSTDSYSPCCHKTGTI